MGQIWIAAAFAVFLWWFSTGAILWAVSRAGRAGAGGYANTLLAAFPVLMAGIAALVWGRYETTPAAVLASFTGAILVWGWLELAFLCGIVTGPVRTRLPPGLPPPQRFLRAWGTIAHHELSLVAGLLLLVVLTWDAAHQVGVLTFLVLFAARISAKLNLFFGVPRINTEFLPRPLQHLASYFRQGPITWAFPAAISLLTVAAGYWIERTIAMPAGSGAETGAALLAALTTLALIEHWLMILKLPDAALWRWMMAPAEPKPGERGPPALPETD
jgi:putative photosynthetic complex assembly protein 2